MTSTHELIAGIPTQTAGQISRNILGHSSDASGLVTDLNEPSKINAIYEGLTTREKMMVADICISGGEMDWIVFSRIYKDDINKAREVLTGLGRKGMVFQGGLTGRDPIILFPSMVTRARADIECSSPSDLSFREDRVPETWKHILMINALKTLGLKCRVGLEPFKKGWTQLEEKLDSIMDIRQIYWELSSLGCLKETNGEITVRERISEAIASEGDLRYKLWRFINSCRPYGIDGEIYTVISDKTFLKSIIERIIIISLARITPPIEEIFEISKRLLNEWIEIGIFREDSSGKYIRLDDRVYKAFDSNEIGNGTYEWKDEVIIQPNMEIIVPKDFNLSDHLNIGEIAELVRADVVSIYRITRQSVLRAIGFSWTAEKIGTFLDRISKHTMPDNIIKTISAWTGTISCARIIRGTFLLSSDKEKIPHGLEELQPGIFRIPDNYEREMEALLEKRGVLVEHEKISEDSELAWGRLLPIKPARKARSSFTRGGLYPYGMVIPLPYGNKGIEMLESVINEGRDIIIFYPKQGYGEAVAHRISPINIYIRSGSGFMEAINEDSGAAETFEIAKIRAVLKQE
ncbi:MAG TPA: helicase-associated domain-containing protein [Desulfomonilia bacterium]